MKALTLWQPWASLCFTPYKGWETRGWSTDYRGVLAIHAAKRIPKPADVSDELDALCRDVFGLYWKQTLPYGCVLGSVLLEGCRPTETVQPCEDERITGDWTPGRFGWDLVDARLLAQPVSAKGGRKLFEWAA